MSQKTAAYIPPQLRNRSSTSSSEESTSSLDLVSSANCTGWRSDWSGSNSSQESISSQGSSSSSEASRISQRPTHITDVSSWRTGGPLQSSRPVANDLAYDEIQIGDVVWFPERRLRRNHELLAQFESTNEKPGDHPAVIVDKRIDEATGQECIRFRLCTSQEKRRNTHYQIEDDSGVSYGRTLDLIPGSDRFPLPTFVEPKPDNQSVWTATSSEFERYKRRDGTPLQIKLTPESVKRLQTCPEWKLRQLSSTTSKPSTRSQWNRFAAPQRGAGLCC